MRLLGKGRRVQSPVPEARRPSAASPETPEADAAVAEPVTAPTTGSTIIEPRQTEKSMLGDQTQQNSEEQADTSIGKGSQIVGTLKFEGTVRIDGQVEGEVTAQESVIIADSAIVKAKVSADTIIITGKVTGDITARRRVEIRAPGQLHGNVTTPSLVIHDGVLFEGQCSMGRGVERKANQKAAATNGNPRPGAADAQSETTSSCTTI